MSTVKRDFIMDHISNEQLVSPDRTEMGYVAENIFYDDDINSDDPMISENATEYNWWTSHSEVEVQEGDIK